MKNNITPINEPNVGINTSFILAQAPTHFTMNNPEFAKLTAAEKLNNSEYRGLVYRSYPNEFTCGCAQSNEQRLSNPTLTINNQRNDSSVKFFYGCPGGCNNSCCSSLRRPPTTNSENNGNDDKVAEGSIIAFSFYCVGNQRTNGSDNSCYSLNKRIRGGGGAGGGSVQDKCQMNTGAVETNGPEHNSWWHRRGSHTPIMSRFTDYPLELHQLGHNELNFNPMAGCCCSGREALISPATASRHKNKRRSPRLEIDKLTRALEDAQKFVDSLGRVPGMAGLGLMDPTESPYFHRSRQQTDEQPLAKINEKNLMHSPMIDSRCGAPYFPHVKSQSATSPWIKATPFTISVPGRSGIVREAIFPQKQHANELQQVIENGPCGEVNCNSRRKTIINREASIKKTEGLGESDQVVYKRNSRRERRYEKYHRRGRRRRVGKSRKEKKLNYVYFAGDVYPGRVYGHKDCSQRRERVPANMGWLWTQYQPGGRLNSRVGWRPGTISRRIREMISEGKAGLERSRRRPASVPSTGRSGKKLKTKSHTSMKKGHSRKLDEDKEELEPPPTLHVLRKNGAYYITMYPITQETINVPKLAEPMKPLQFTIPKRFDDSSEASSSTASDMDIEFSPPAAVNRYRKKPDVIHVEVEAKQLDIIDTLKSVDSKGREFVEPEKPMKKEKKKKKSRKQK